MTEPEFELLLRHFPQASSERGQQHETTAEEAAAEVQEAENTQTIEEQYTSALGRAIAYWQSDSYIPLTLVSDLMAEGYDVGSLEARYLMKG